MREDMYKVIVERPRHKPWAKPGRKPKYGSYDGEPGFIGMRRFHKERHDYKPLNENLAPLRRYLFKQVGRPWNKVYAEISQHLRADNAVQQHVRDHIRDFVEVCPRPEVKSRWYRHVSTPWRQPLYVHATTGLLCRTDRLPEVKAAKRKKARRAVHMPDCIALDVDRELRCLEGCWYEIKLAALPEPEYREVSTTVVRRLGYGSTAHAYEADVIVRRLVTPAVTDVVTGRSRHAGPECDEPELWKRYRSEFPDRRYAVSKRSLSHAGLKRHGLSNCHR